MTDKKALLFDFDGVLVDTFDLCYGIIKSFDPSLTQEEYRKRFLGNINDYKPERDIEKKADFDFFAHYAPRLLQLEMDPGVKNTILQLSKDYPLFIVSSTTTEPIKKFLEQSGLDHCFEGIYGNDVHTSKVEKIRMILEKYSLDPARCLFITDTLGDIREAKKCGMNSIAVSWGFHSDETLREGDPVTIADSITDLIDAIEKNF